MNSCHGMEDIDMDPKRIKPGWLRQSDIDNGPLPPVSRNCAFWREALEYFGVSNLFFIIGCMVVFAAAGYLAYLIWQLPEYYRALAVKG